MSWWRHFESEVPNLAALGVTQVWLPPPNKAMRKVSVCPDVATVWVLNISQEGQGYDAYDLVSMCGNAWPSGRKYIIGVMHHMRICGGALHPMYNLTEQST